MTDTHGSGFSRRRALQLMALPAFGAALAACGTSGSSGGAVPSTVPADLKDLYRAARKEGEVTYYSQLSVETLNALHAKVVQLFPGINMNFVRLATAEISTRVSAEVKSGNILGDFFTTSDIVWLSGLQQAGSLMKFQSPDFAVWPANAKVDGYYFANAIYLCIIAYNKNSTSAPKVATWESLPTFGKRSGTYDPRGTGGPYTLVAGIQQIIGPSWWAECAKNGTQFFESTGQISPELTSGQLIVGAGQHDTFTIAAAQGQPVGLSFPKEGCFESQSYGAIPKGTKHPNAAQLLARFMMSKQGQELLAQSAYVYSPRPDVKPASILPPLSSLNVISFSAAQIKAHETAYQDAAVKAAGLPLS